MIWMIYLLGIIDCVRHLFFLIGTIILVVAFICTLNAIFEQVLTENMGNLKRWGAVILGCFLLVTMIPSSRTL